MTPAIKLLKKQNVDFEILSYKHDPSNTDFGKEVVEKLGLNEDEVFKTLLVDIGLKDFVVTIVSVSKKLSLKKIADVCGVKKATLADTKKVQKTTGYLIGGVSPLGQKKRLKTYIQKEAQELIYMYVSGGKRGVDIKLKPEDLLRLSDGIFCDIAV